MSHPDKSYIWTIGYRDNGAPMISGPFVSQEDAADGTDHLTHVKFIRLATRDRNKALPQIRDRIRHGVRRSPAPPADDATKRSIMQKVLHRSEKDDPAPTSRGGIISRVLRHEQEKDDADAPT